MSFLKKSLLILVVFITIGLLGYSTWHQWRDNRTTILERMRPIPPIATFSHGGSIRHIAFDPKNPDLIATAGDGNIVNVWNRNKHDSPQLTLEAYKVKGGNTYMVDLAFSPTDNWIATKTFWTLEIWDSTSGSKLNTIHTASSIFAISPVGNRIATDNVDLTLWEVNDPKIIKGEIMLPPKMDWSAISLDGLERTAPYPERNIDILRFNIPREYRNASINQNFRSIDFSYDGKWIAAAGQVIGDNDTEWRQKVKIWDLQDQQLYRIIEREDAKKPDPKSVNKKTPYSRLPASNDIRSVTFSPNNRFFALAADNGYTIWSLPEWIIYHEVLDHRISDIAFSPDGSMYAVADVKGITLWDIETLTPIVILMGKGFLAMVKSIEFSSDGNTIAGGGFDGVLRLWDVRDYYAE